MKTIFCSPVLIASLLTSLTSMAAEIPKPGFDCAKATTKTEKTICGSRELAILDSEMAGLYRTLIAGEYPRAATNQRQWLETRNDCDKTPKIEHCLLDLYKKRVKELVGLHIDANRYSSAYCAEKCFYQWGFEVEDFRIGDNAVEYLVSNGRYSYGVVTTEYYIGMLEKNRLGSKKQICWKQVQDDGRGAISGDKDCTSEKAKTAFRAAQR